MNVGGAVGKTAVTGSAHDGSCFSVNPCRAAGELRFKRLDPQAAAPPSPVRSLSRGELGGGARPDLDSAASGLGAHVPEAAVVEVAA